VKTIKESHYSPIKTKFMKKLLFASIIMLFMVSISGCTKSLETSNNPPVTATNGNTGANNGNNGNNNNDNNPPVTATNGGH
jgi:hypothetical protein